MNTLITPETKQLLFDKGWRYELSTSYDTELGGIRVNHSLGEQRWNEGKNLTYVDITIADVVMWLYEKHGIWVSVYSIDDSTIFRHCFSNIDFNSPTEAYTAGIKYCLANLL